ncbi:unnamed protein product [Prorocentrum cordatum]|uniref:Alpha-type protein kinase domain-containing protein n=1 Tax=Prorocentrum cordatum TaxID=2364126 RepID=A0ABN9RV50_9DINO|nr:unnamed protein product [Polarella glacialis]
MPPRGKKAVCVLCGTCRSNLPASWTQHDCLAYCAACWDSVRCTDCSRSDPKGTVLRGRWTCRACQHKHKASRPGDVTETCHRLIIEDGNGEPLGEEARPCGAGAAFPASSGPEGEDSDGDLDGLAPLPSHPRGQRAGPTEAAREAGHVVLLLDASGSMRTEDVEADDAEAPGGQASRLHAALRCAAEFAVGHAQARPLDAFSCAVFGESAEVIAEAVDADGLKLALGAVAIRGVGGTFYAEGLRAAARLLALRPGAPAHVVVLSDGRPADTKKALELFQRDFVPGPRVHGIAFGSTVESFAALQQLACISGGSFSMSGRSIRALCTAFSSVSSTITSIGSGVSFEVVGSQHRHATRKVDFELPEVGVFGKRGVLRFRAARSSFRYDGAEFHEQRWDASDVARREKPYMRGGMRLVYGFQDAEVVKDTDSWMVAKGSRFRDAALNDRRTVEAHAKSTAVARFFAARFNEATWSDRSAGELPTLFFVPCFVYDVEGEPLGEEARHFCAERYLPGVFLKYNSNNGWVHDGPVRHQDAVQAFLHFSYAATGGRMMVADLQGVARPAEVLLTDPQVLSLEAAFGPGDLGAPGMRACLAAHRCGPSCRRLGLQPPSSAALRRLGAAQPGGGAPSRSARLASGCSSRAPSASSSGWEKLSEDQAGLAEGFAVVDKASLSSGSSLSSWIVAAT